MKPILVTGSTGFVGRHLVPELLAGGRPVRALARTLARARDLATAGAEVVRGDLLDPESMARAVQGCSAVVHLAAVADSSDPELNEAVNVGGSHTLVAACLQHGVSRIINISSTCAGRSMQDAYGETKARAEAEFDREGLEVTHLRPSMIYGHGSAEFDLFAKVVHKAPRVPIPGDGSARIRPVYVLDAVALIIAALDRDAAVGQTYDVSGPEQISFDQFIELLGEAQGRRARPLHIPAPLALTGARILGRIQKHPFINVDQVMAFLQDTVVDIEPARRDLAFDPRPLEEGLAELFGGAP